MTDFFCYCERSEAISRVAFFQLYGILKATMFAIIKTGGKQYKVKEGDTLAVEKLAAKAGESIVFTEVLLVGGEKTEVGSPYVRGAKVAAKVAAEGRGEKKTVFRYHSKARERKLKGHRQPFTTLRIESVTL